MTMGEGTERKKHALKQAIREAFAEITTDNEWDLPARLLASMPARLEAVRTS